MRKLFIVATIAALALLGGCAAFSDLAVGRIEEGIPKLREQLPPETKVWVMDPVNVTGCQLHARGAKNLQTAFRNALKKYGVASAKSEEKCDVALYLAVTRWEYGDAGFSGQGKRDDISFSAMVRRKSTDRIITRSELKARDIDGIAEKYVKYLFKIEGED